MSPLYRHANSCSAYATHSNFTGNPRKQGIINITDAPSLPISQREKVKKVKPTPASVSKRHDTTKDWTTDKRLVLLSSLGRDLTDKEAKEWERGIRQFQEVVSPNDPDYRYHHNRVLKHRNGL